jgi:serine/threonine protein kinase
LSITEITNTDETFIQEIGNLAELRHPNIVSFFGCGLPTQTQPVKIATDFVSTQTLDSIIADRPAWLTPTIVARMIVELVSVMSYIHSREIVHRCLEPRNILVDSDHHIKLSNFSFSRLIDLGATLTVEAGVDYYYYHAPEIYDTDSTEEYEKSVDVFFIWHPHL